MLKNGTRHLQGSLIFLSRGSSIGGGPFVERLAGRCCSFFESPMSLQIRIIV